MWQLKGLKNAYFSNIFETMFLKTDDLKGWYIYNIADKSHSNIGKHFESHWSNYVISEMKYTDNVSD